MPVSRGASSTMLKLDLHQRHTAGTERAASAAGVILARVPTRTEFIRTSIHSSVVNSRRFSMNSSRLMTQTWNGVKSVTLNGRIFLLWISVSS